MGVASCRWVRPVLTTPSFSASRRLNVAISASISGKRLSSIAVTAAMCIAVGNVSLDDWDMFTWSLGWHSFSPSISLARLAMTSLAFMLDWVPLPVCHTTSGKWSFRLPDMTSSHAWHIAPRRLSSMRSGFMLLLAIAAAFLSMPNA